MRAVSAKVWNGWKATLLRELYQRVCRGAGRRAGDHRARRARQPRQGRRGGAAEGLAGRGGRDLSGARLPRLLAGVRSGDACPPRPPGARRRGAPGAADRRHHAAAGPRGDRGDGLLRRPRRPVQQDLRRARRGRRLDRRCAHPHADQRHGARHVLDPGRRRRHLRGAAPAGQARGADRAGAVRAHSPGDGDSQGLQVAARPAHAGDQRAAARGDRQPCVEPLTPCWR